MKCLQCDKEFESKRIDARFCSGKCRIAYHRNELSVTKDTVTDKSVTDNVTDKEVKTVKDFGIELKDLGVLTAGEGLPIMISPFITLQQVQDLVSVMNAMKGNFEWEPRCGYGNTF
jgi:hypothetical protein